MTSHTFSDEALFSVEAQWVSSFRQIRFRLTSVQIRDGFVDFSASVSYKLQFGWCHLVQTHSGDLDIGPSNLAFLTIYSLNRLTPLDTMWAWILCNLELDTADCDFLGQNLACRGCFCKIKILSSIFTLIVIHAHDFAQFLLCFQGFHVGFRFSFG